MYIWHTIFLFIYSIYACFTWNLNLLPVRLQFSMSVLIDSCFQHSVRSIYVHSAKRIEATCCYSLVVEWNLFNSGKAMHSQLSMCPKVHSRLVRKPVFGWTGIRWPLVLGCVRVGSLRAVEEHLCEQHPTLHISLLRDGLALAPLCLHWDFGLFTGSNECGGV